MNRFFLMSSFIFKVRVLSLCFTLIGCSQTLQHEFATVEQTPLPSYVQSMGSPEPEDPSSVIAWAGESTSTEVSPLRPEAFTASTSREDARIEEVLERIALKNHLYLAKDGSLMGDFTLHNQSSMPVSKILIECMEYNPHQELLRTSSRVLSDHTTLMPDTEQRFEHVDFGYVENNFDTVNCRLHSAKVSENVPRM